MPEGTTHRWEGTWEVDFPGSEPPQLVLALMVRDLLHGASFDLDLAGDAGSLAIDYLAGDELDDDVYRLLVTAQVTGAEEREAVRELTREVLEQLVSEAEELVGTRRRLAAASQEDIGFLTVDEDQERWDLVIPDWLAPDGAEVPFGFRPVHRVTGEMWPADDLLDAHGRVVLIPESGSFALYALPGTGEDTRGGGGIEELPVVE